MTRFQDRALAAFVLLAAATPAFGQDKVYRSVDAVAGRTMRLAVVENVAQDCKLGPLPEIKVLTSPKQGSLAVRSGKAKAGTLSRCPNLEVPRQGVFYQAKPKYVGADEVAFEIKRADGRVESVTVKINVTDQPKRGAKPDTVDL
jgi:hypothetical protein